MFNCDVWLDAATVQHALTQTLLTSVRASDVSLWMYHMMVLRRRDWKMAPRAFESSPIGRALDLDLVAVMPVHSGVPVFCHGVMGDVSDWGALCSEAGLESEAAARQRVEGAIELTDITKHEYAPAADGLAVRRRAIVIGAVDDGYMPEWSIRATAAHLAKHHDVKLQWIGGGHCSTVVARKALVRDAIVDVLKRPPAIGHS